MTTSRQPLAAGTGSGDQLPDLNECDREPIRIPGSVQPQGVLLALSPQALTIRCVSENSADLLSSPPRALLGRALADVLGEALAAAVRTADARWRPAPAGEPTQSARFRWHHETVATDFWCAVHRSGDTILLELEPQPEPESDGADDAHVRVAQALEGMSRVRSEADLIPKLAAAVDLLRQITGYDRVMIYRFDPDWHGEVVAESRRDDLPPYLGLHYPATDIPRQAGRLYRESQTRIIVDIDDRPSALLPPQGPDCDAPLDLSRCVLRSVSPVHIEYLRNMGVRATLTASLVHQGQLWGLVACHHYSPRMLPGPTRDLVGWLAQDLATQIALAERLAARAERIALRVCRERVLSAMRDGANLADLLVPPWRDSLLNALGADGVAVIRGDEVVAAGSTPTPQRIKEVARRLGTAVPKPDGELTTTSCLSRLIPGTEDIADSAAGVLILPLTARPDIQLLAFRGEQLQHVSWAGEPGASKAPNADGRLSPRQSFAAWREIVRLQAPAWSDEVITSARALAVLMDIELRRVAERARDAALAKYRALFEHCPLGITVWNRSGVIVETNPASTRMLGVESPEHEGWRIDGTEWRIERPDGTPMQPSEYASVRACRGRTLVRNQELMLVAPDGGKRWLDVSAAPLPINDLGALVVYEDITERKLQQAQREAEVAQREGDRRVRLVIDQLPMLIWANEGDLNCTMVNKTYREFVGLPEDACTGLQWLERLHPDDRDAYREAFNEQLRLRRPFYGICRARRSDGAWRWMETHAQPYFDDDGALIRVVGSTLDITERKAAEDALKESHQVLGEYADQLGQLTSALALAEQRERERLAKLLHDHLQQLLVGATFGMDRLERGLASGAPAADGLDAAANVKKLLQEAIDAARTLVADLSPPILHEGGLKPAFEWLARWMEQTHHLFVALWVDTDVEPTREDLRRVLFESVREALFNVVKHADCDSAQVRIDLDPEARLRISIRDHGEGFDVARLDDGAREGTGFGLLAMRERLRRLGGACGIESTPGAGTCITLSVPLPPTELAEPVREDVAVPAVEQQPPAVPVAANKGAEDAGIRVLLVDDHAMMREGLRSLLADQPGITVVGEAGDGVEALEMVARLQPRLVLMDYSMPRMDGLEATRRLRAAWPELCIIGLSMYQEAERADAMRAAGACAYVDKTAGAAALLGAIREGLAATGVAASAAPRPTSSPPGP